ncbi:MAG: hypothetical protein GX336_05525 [Halanaerobiaceae bacterium]|nr:hypothetical protein [Halanaerobiaceae bacterium]
MELLVFHLPYNRAGLEVIKKYYSIFDKLIPAWLGAAADGSIRIHDDAGTIHQYMNKKKIIPMVQNLELSSRVSNSLVKDKEAVNRFTADSLAYLKKRGYEELCLDIEGVKYENRESYTDFIGRVAENLHGAGFHLSICIPAKTGNSKDSTWSGAYDYNKLGKIADRIIIMAYDFHWPGGPPGPIAPINWLQDVIDYAIMEIPLEKIYFALGLYGYDWPLKQEERGRGLVYRQIAELAGRYKKEIEWDQESRCPYMKYEVNGVEHEVWFENRCSIESKLRLLQDFQLKGVVFWRPGQEDPEVWELFKDK